MSSSLVVGTARGQARRVGSVEGGSFIFWEVFFSTRDANTSAEGVSI